MRVAYFDCFSGISGDMCLAAIVSAGWSRAELEALPRRLHLAGVEVNVTDVRRGPFMATQVTVETGAKQPHRHLHQIRRMLEVAEIEPEVRDRAGEVFLHLAQAEAEVHGSTLEKVHFHEVGAADALVDIVGTVAGLRALGVEEVYASPLRLGRGAVQSDHGLIPVPAPATVNLLRGVPVEMPDIEAELVTPTGAALVTTLVKEWGGVPAFRLERVGTGAGRRDLKEQPNVLRLMIGDRGAHAESVRRVAVLETALDDENPQILAALIPRLLGAGALDAMLVPALMKKGRPGHWLIVLADPPRATELARLVMVETGTLGVRIREEERLELARRSVEVATPFGSVTLKVAQLPDGERAAPEFESVRQAAERTGAPLREVAEAAIHAWRTSRRE